jgi:cephalosporin-C deacetylase-like acetyl esterase
VKRQAAAALAAVVMQAGAQAPAQRGPWNLAEIEHPPQVWWIHRTGVQRSLYYENVPYRGRPSRVFAYFAVPERVSGKVPAMILVHGGGGRAFPEWAAIWAQRGYAALAMDLGGRGPDGKRHADAGPDQTDKEKFYWLGEGEREAWTYHSIAAIMRGISLLASQPEVDPQRIGITGISWGGYLTSLAAGVDDRLKVAIPVYGCGFLHENSVWKPLLDRMPAEARGKWVKLFDPSTYLAGARVPMLWINGTNDFAYPLDSYQKSYRQAKGPRTLRVTVNMPHGHSQGWEPPEICMFADQHLRGGTPLAELSLPERDGETLRVKYRAAVPLLDASLHYSADQTAWSSRRWTSVPARVTADSIEARLPEDRPLTFFVTATDLRGAIVSTEHQELP